MGIGKRGGGGGGEKRERRLLRGKTAVYVLLGVGTSCMGTHYVPGTYDVPCSVVYIVYIQ